MGGSSWEREPYGVPHMGRGSQRTFTGPPSMMARNKEWDKVSERDIFF